MRDFDLVLFGVTGFVGRLTAEYLAEAAPAGTRIALAGRGVERVRKVRDSLPAAARSWDVLHADAADADSLRAMVARTQVVVTTVGPYAEYGLPLVLACADAGTDYADLTGEALFVRASAEQAHERAVATSTRIVHSCGYDSIPSDLSVYLTYRKALEDGAGELTDATLVATAKGGISGGTIASGRGQMRAVADDPGLRKVVADPYSLSAERDKESDLGEQPDTAFARASSIHPSLSGWVATFIMASYNTRIVRRSNSLLGWAYGKDFRYREVMSAGRSRLAPLVAAGVAGALWATQAVGPLLHKGPGAALLGRIVPKPGAGPSEQVRKSGFFRMETITRTSSGRTYRTTFAGKGDPGYQATAVMLGQAGLCLAFDRDKLTDLGGVLTPATAMAAPLTDRLRAAGLTIEVAEVTRSDSVG